MHNYKQIAQARSSPSPLKPAYNSQNHKHPAKVLEQTLDSFNGNSTSVSDATLIEDDHKEVDKPQANPNDQRRLEQTNGQDSEQLKQQLKAKDSKILKLETQVRVLKQEEEYLLRSIEEMRQKGVTSAVLNAKNRQIDAKNLEIEYLKKQVEKLQQWLNEEKEEVSRTIQCIKVKDSIISSLQAELQKLKVKMIPKPKNKRRSTQSQAESNKQEDELGKYRNRSEQLEEQIHYLTEYIEKLKHEHTRFPIHSVSLSNQADYEELESPIFGLKGLSKKSMEESSTGISFKKYQLLVGKCAFLEAQLQKFLGMLSQSSQACHFQPPSICLPSPAI